VPEHNASFFLSVGGGETDCPVLPSQEGLLCTNRLTDDTNEMFGGETIVKGDRNAPRRAEIVPLVHHKFRVGFTAARAPGQSKFGGLHQPQIQTMTVASYCSCFL
jgi:hypothetical protein